MVHETKYIILTGAGLTANIGVWTASEIRYQLYKSKISGKSRIIHDLLTSHENYETIYSKILGNPEITEPEKEEFYGEIYSVFKLIDDTVCRWVDNSETRFPFKVHVLDRFFNRFSERNTYGMIFTLNQDLFLERCFHEILFETPGARLDRIELSLKRPIGAKDLITLPTEAEIDKIRAKTRPTHIIDYIKLHGSFNWIDSSGRGKLIIGKNKLDEIIKEPLLKWYYERFLSTLESKGLKKLLIIGYGFGDQHINRAIENALNKNSFKICIIDPRRQEETIEAIKKTGTDPRIILDNLDFYEYGKLADLFWDSGDINYTRFVESLFA